MIRENYYTKSGITGMNPEFDLNYVIVSVIKDEIREIRTSKVRMFFDKKINIQEVENYGLE